MPLHHTMDGERTLQGTAAVKALEQRHEVGQPFGEGWSLEVMAGHQLGDEGVHVGQFAEHRRTDAMRCSAPGGFFSLARSIPSSSVRSPGTLATHSTPSTVTM